MVSRVVGTKVGSCTDDQDGEGGTRLSCGTCSLDTDCDGWKTASAQLAW